MSEWVWFAPGQRLQHLALMRSSAASLRFARINLALLTIALGLFMVSQVGWKWVAGSAAAEPTGRLTPAGQGWLHVATTPSPPRHLLAAEVPVDLWWSTPLAGAAVLGTLLFGLLGGWLAMALLRAGVTWAHRPPYRAEHRMTAALHYNTAWVAPMLMGAFVLILLPLAYMGAIARWSIVLPQLGLRWAGAVVIAFGAGMWWFWLIRLGMTAPPATRTRVVTFFAVGAPLIVGGITAVWYFGLPALIGQLSVLLHWQF